LLEEGAILSIYDPKVSVHKIEEEFEQFSFNNQGIWRMANSIPNALENLDAVLILTEWNVCIGLDLYCLASLMRSPACMFETRSVVNRQEK
tara:strand:- start:175 stop:447 length:273 start_codon:yes stop_codon:yes gene_type:complete